jgi:methyl-accepting chemotaxis protein
MRSEQSLQAIRNLIGSATSDIHLGIGLVKDLAATQRGIVDVVKAIDDLASEIAAGSQEQAAGADQVSKAVIEMDGMTQQNAALVSETEASMRGTLRQVEELRRVVSRFYLGRQQSAETAHANAGRP